VRQARISAIYKERGKKLRKSHDNPKIKQIYGEFLLTPLGEKSHHLLHTGYTKRERVKTGLIDRLCNLKRLPLIIF